MEANHSDQKRRILVTGGAGYLGSVMVPKLLDDGYAVTILDNFTFGEQPLKGFRSHPDLNIIRDDILNHENHVNLFKNIYGVVHLAGISNDPTSDLDPSLTVKLNYFATVSLARRAKTEGVKRFIFMSSCSVYGASADAWLDENTKTDPVTLYALTKLESEPILLSLNSSDFSVTILRLATLFGYSPRMRFDLAINVMAKRAIQGLELILNGDGEQYRPFLHVADISKTVSVILNLDANKISGKVYNVGRNEMNYKISDLAHEIVGYFPGCKLKRVPDNADARSYRVSFDKIKNELGIVPEKTVKDGVDELKTAVKSGALTDLDDNRYYNIKVIKATTKSMERFYSPAATAMWTDVLPAINEAHGTAKVRAADVTSLKKKKIVAVVLAYNCEKMLNRAYERIPKHLVDDIIVMDDGSSDNTSGRALELGLKVFRHAPNRGYGGNLKAGLQKAFELGADYVVEVHGDGAQFDPISIQYALPYMQQGFDLILGSRFQNPRNALANGMPMIRFVANHFLSFFDRWVLKLPLTEFHTGFRIYSRHLVENVPYQQNSEDYLFSFQIIAQAAYYNMRVGEVPVEADYKSEHTSHKLTGAFIYAFQTFAVLAEYTMARWGWVTSRIFKANYENADLAKDVKPAAQDTAVTKIKEAI